MRPNVWEFISAVVILAAVIGGLRMLTNLGRPDGKSAKVEAETEVREERFTVEIISLPLKHSLVSYTAYLITDKQTGAEYLQGSGAMVRIK